MDPKKIYKAEDLLSDPDNQEKKQLISEGEKELAKEIQSAIKSAGKEKLSSLETAQLWERIQNSTAPKTSRWKLYLQIAAMFIVVLSMGTWLAQHETNRSKLLDFAAQNINKKNVSYRLKRPGQENQANRPAEENEDENIITANDFNTLVVRNGQRSVIKLPDSTKVWLNSGSKLIYPVAFSNESREVYLEGEAYFDVTHDKEHPFHVHSKSMDIKVLGTEFYISSNTKSKIDYAVLVKGSIEFSTGTWLNKTVRKLVPGERINYDLAENKLLISTVKTEEFESWKTGYLDINSEPLSVIIQRVAKYYHIEINTEGLNLGNETFSGRLDFQRSADDVLAILCIGTPYIYNSAERRLMQRKIN